MSGVLFFSYSRDITPLDGLKLLLSRSKLLENIPSNADVAIKLHMGDMGSIRYIRPVFAWQVASLIREQGGKPYLFDTVAAYPGKRRETQDYLNTAAVNGFTETGTGARVVIAGDEDSFLTVPINNRVDGAILESADIPEKLLKSDFLVVLSHVKGHGLTGFGGAIKNLGMGCVSTKTKQSQHVVNSPQLKENADCTGCGICVSECPRHALTLVENRVQKDEPLCTGCTVCYYSCPEHCWQWPEGAREKLQVNLAHAVGAVLSAYKGQVLYINFVQDVIPFCDCMPTSAPPVVQDVGIMLSLDPVAIDKASLDVVDMAPIIEPKATPKPPDILGKIHETSSYIQLQTAEKLGVGEMKYSLVSV
jgi:uncharacterized Fe-S center protein